LGSYRAKVRIKVISRLDLGAIVRGRDKSAVRVRINVRGFFKDRV
jgi:hypothetical protein